MPDPKEKAQPVERLEHADERFQRSIKVDPWPTGRPNSPPPKKAGK